MLRRRGLIVGSGAAAAMAALAIGIGSAVAAGGAPSKATLNIAGGEQYAINKHEQNTFHWAPGTVTIKSGGTLTIVNHGDKGEPHTFSIVKPSQLPKTTNQLNNCAVCLQIAMAHGINPGSHMPPTKPLVDVGKPGFDEPGDSVALPPGFKKLSVKITASAGKTLNFMCAVHSWMQGKVKVK